MQNKIIKNIEDQGFAIIKSFLNQKEVNFFLNKINQLDKKTKIQFKVF